MGFLPRLQVSSSCIEDSNVVFFGYLAGQGGTELPPEWFPNFIVAPNQVPVVGGTLIAAVNEAVGVFTDQQVFAQHQDLFWSHGPSAELFNMLGALNLYHQFSGEVQASLKIPFLASCSNWPENEGGALTMEAHGAMGPILLGLGRCEEALEHLNAASELYATYHDHRHSVFIGLNCKVVSECYAARAMWALGFPDQALQRAAVLCSLREIFAMPKA